MAKKTKDTKEPEERLRSAFDAPRMGGFYRFAPEDVVIPGIDNKVDRSHPLYDISWRHEIDEALVESIMDVGVHTTVKVRKDGDAPEVVDGRRRVLHAREANKRLKKLGREPVTVPCQVFKLASDKDATLLMLSSNAHGLADDPIDRAEKAAKALRLNATEEEIAKAIGVTAAAVRDVLKLIDCSDRVKDAVRQGRMTASAAVKMTDLTRTEQDSVLDELLQGEKKPTVRETGQVVAEKRAQKAAEKATEKPSAPASDGGESRRRPAVEADSSVDPRNVSRGASADFAPGRKGLREAIEVMRPIKSEFNKGFIAALKFALGEEVPTQLVSARELAEAEAAESAAKKAKAKSK
jgi:ParB family transcriptional regulator, chromosome partitioning protein